MMSESNLTRFLQSSYPFGNLPSFHSFPQNIILIHPISHVNCYTSYYKTMRTQFFCFVNDLMRAIFVLALFSVCVVSTNPLPKKLQFRKDGTFTVLQVSKTFFGSFEVH